MKKQTLAILAIISISSAVAEENGNRVTTLPGVIFSETARAGSYSSQDGVSYSNTQLKDMTSLGRSYLEAGKAQPSSISVSNDSLTRIQTEGQPTGQSAP